jgi:hypothetical protein
MSDLKINGALASDTQRTEIKEALGLNFVSYNLVANATLSLPASPRIGERRSATITATSSGYTLKIMPASGQRIYVGNLAGAVGNGSTSGFLQSPSFIGAYAELVYAAANIWVVTSATGTWNLDQ